MKRHIPSTDPRCLRPRLVINREDCIVELRGDPLVRGGQGRDDIAAEEVTPAERDTGWGPVLVLFAVAFALGYLVRSL